MALPQALPAALGTLAILATTAIFTVHILLSLSLSDAASSGRATFIVSATLQALVLVGLSGFVSSYLWPSTRISRALNFTGIWFGVSVLTCAVAAAVSVAALVSFGNSSSRSTQILGGEATSFLIGSSVALGLSFPVQLVFLVVHFIVGRVQAQGGSRHFSTEDGHRSPQPAVKSIPYHETSPNAPKVGARRSTDSRSPPGSSAGHSVTDTVSSIRSSLSHIVRPISSKTRLLASSSLRSSQRSSRRPASLDSNAFREQPALVEDGFDSWDTSAVDPQNRLTVLESSSPPPGRFLETIPASPTTSRSPSPGTPLDLEPPRRTRRRSRSYSPAPDRVRQAQRTAFTQQSAASESHIHPLFRSDSPTPPPIATPGTIVVAAPNAGQVISDRQSIRTLTRMRSGSLPAVPSPLSHQGSFDSFRKVDTSSPELPEESEPSSPVFPEAERKMTPPIPDWILSAGSRSSLTDYHMRKSKTPEG
ncbi:hypothetical protein GQ53DRAFT_225149 [Thozetella sp. PMI_491]|nr:hypothetical protein GQ53DRAFT_225149 [Thozetella sp. PMI_491]